MNCKFCNAELQEGVTLCPECGKENLEETVEEIAVEEMTEEIAGEEVSEEITEAESGTDEITEQTETAPRQKPKVWLIVLAAIGAVALVAVLVCAVLYGTGAFNKTESYTVSDQKAVNTRQTVVATVGDEKLTNSALQVYYWQNIGDFYNTYGYYLDASVLDMTKPLDQQIYDAETNMTWQQFFVESALTAWSRYAALCMQAREEGFTMPEDLVTYLESVPQELLLTAIDNGYDSVAAMLEADMGPSSDESGYMDYVKTNLFAGQYMEAKYDDMEPTMEEIEAYYQENEATLNEQGIANDGSITTDVRHILVCPQGGTEDAEGNVTYSDEEWEACRDKAQKLLDQWKAEGGTEELFAQYAMEHTEDPGSMSTGGLYTDVTLGQMVEPFEEWCFDESRQAGDTGLVKTTFGYHIMYFVDSEEIWIANVRDTIIYERSLELVNGAAEKWPMDVNYKKIAMGAIGTETAE